MLPLHHLQLLPHQSETALMTEQTVQSVVSVILQ
jgi:hypothetical protein